jgi:hypothetical protein
MPHRHLHAAHHQHRKANNANKNLHDRIPQAVAVSLDDGTSICPKSDVVERWSSNGKNPFIGCMDIA